MANFGDVSDNMTQGLPDCATMKTAERQTPSDDAIKPLKEENSSQVPDEDSSEGLRLIIPAVLLSFAMGVYLSVQGGDLKSAGFETVLARGIEYTAELAAESLLNVI
jgi:hypothetical protein